MIDVPLISKLLPFIFTSYGRLFCAFLFLSSCSDMAFKWLSIAKRFLIRTSFANNGARNAKLRRNVIDIVELPLRDREPSKLKAPDFRAILTGLIAIDSLAPRRFLSSKK